MQYMFPDAAITPRSDARPARARAVAAERRDAHPHRVRRARRIELVRARRAELVDHDVGVGEQRVERGVVGGERDAPACPRSTRGRSLPVEQVAGGRDDAHDVGAEVAEHARRARRRVAAEIEDAQPVEQPFCHSEILREPT